jgi:hypothetical protein
LGIHGLKPGKLSLQLKHKQLVADAVGLKEIGPIGRVMDEYVGETVYKRGVGGSFPGGKLQSHEGIPALVCTSFVDVVLAKTIRKSIKNAEALKPGGYKRFNPENPKGFYKKLGEKTIFELYGGKHVDTATQANPKSFKDIMGKLDKGKVYGFRQVKAGTNKSKHVGFLFFSEKANAWVTVEAKGEKAGVGVFSVHDAKGKESF